MTDDVTMIKTTGPGGAVSYRSMADRDTTAQAIDRVADAAKKLVDTFHSAADLSKLPTDISGVLLSACNEISGTPGTAYLAKVTAEAHLANDVMYPAGRERLAKQEIGDAMAQITESLDSAEAKIDVADALLYQAARPAMPSGADVAAREDCRMVLDRIETAGEIGQVAKQLAARSDAVGALVTDSAWLRLYLDSRKVDSKTADAIQVLVRGAMLPAAAESGDPQRVAAGRTALALVHLRKAVIAARSYQRNTL
ncbi:hypothetical protein [Streptomyces sp. NPDC005385]|uniref:hypothetical protein n=1 Tax=Streptomyces sp. NPDC005385 TaxID=3157039 RepID=UPI0033B16ABF